METEVESELETEMDFVEDDVTIDHLLNNDQTTKSNKFESSYKLRIIFRLERGSVILENIRENNSLILFIQEVQGDFQSRLEM